MTDDYTIIFGNLTRVMMFLNQIWLTDSQPLKNIWKIQVWFFIFYFILGNFALMKHPPVFVSWENDEEYFVIFHPNNSHHSLSWVRDRWKNRHTDGGTHWELTSRNILQQLISTSISRKRKEEKKIKIFFFCFILQKMKWK